MSQSERIQLGGRTFVQVGESSLRHDLRFLELRKRAGLDRVVIEVGEDLETWAWRLVGNATASGATFLELIGTLIMPVDAPKWTPELARETGEFLGELTDPEDKRKVRSLAASMFIDFFAEGISSLETFHTSSGESAPGTTAESPPPATSIPSDFGAGSSGSSPTTTPSGSSG